MISSGYLIYKLFFCDFVCVGDLEVCANIFDGWIVKTSFVESVDSISVFSILPLNTM